MSSRSRVGFTLVELLVALVIFVMVAGSLYRVLNVSQRTARTQTEKAAMQGTLRTGLQLAIAEIQEIWTDQPTGGSGITGMTPTKLTYEAMRGLGITCSATTATTIIVRKSSYAGVSDPRGGQSVYVFAEKNDSTEDDDEWRDRAISTVASGSCDDGDPAWRLTVTGLTITGLSAGAIPVRTHEATVLGLVAANGRNWLGIGTGGVLTPLAGPLTSAGLSFTYLDAANSPTGTAANVKSIVLRLYGETERQADSLSGHLGLLSDSMIVRVQLRNGR